MSEAVQPAWRLDALLGEGPLWCPDEEALRFVDIKRGLLHRFHPGSGTGESVAVGGQPSFIVQAADNGFVVGRGHELRRFDGRALGETIARLDMPAHNRTNDATVDLAGRLWFGTMDDEEQAPTGALHRLSNEQLTTATWRAVVTNGPAVTQDGKHLYHVDSGERTIWRVPLRGGRCGRVGEPFVELQAAEGYPDGVVLDAEDCLWVALWDGWAVRRYGPDGRLLAHVTMPCARPTKVAFGGADLCTAYVTTARTGLCQAELEQQPLAGSLLQFRTSAPGRVLQRVRLD